MTTGLEGIATKARQEKRLRFTSLAHHITREKLWENLKKIPSNTSAGVDAQDVAASKEKFALWSEEMLNALYRRGYKPAPARRVYIPKPGSTQKRPIAVPTVSDRALQKTVTDILNAIYEEDFLNCSFGGRPKRSAHHAVATLERIISAKKINWVFEADLRNFFGSLNQDWVKRFLSERVGDPRIMSLIHRWLRAGVMEEGQHQVMEQGTAQGGPISVLISNIYLHYALDLWVEKVVRPKLKGEMYYIRYLDDFVLCFEYHADAVKFRDVLEKRLNKFALELEPSKTRLIEFGRLARRAADKKGTRTETFSFLGFTFYDSKNRHGRYKVGMKTERKRLHRSCVKIKAMLRRYRHDPIREQKKRINVMLSGHNRYYGMPGNSKSLDNFYHVTLRYWREMLSSRSQNGKLNWDKYNRILKLFPLCQPRLHVTYTELSRLVML